ncbi:MAG: two-component regulator propeller domain-containing protein [Saprospiraceae bacterium]
MIQKVITFIATYFCFTVLFAQYEHEVIYDISAGLPYQEVTNIYKDKNGHIWVEYSTQDYISHFDGINWTHHDFGNLGIEHGFAIKKITKTGICLAKFYPNIKLIKFAYVTFNNKCFLFQKEGIIIEDLFYHRDEILYLGSDHKIYEYVDNTFVQSDLIFPKNLIEKDLKIVDAKLVDSTCMVIYCERGQKLVNLYYKFGEDKVTSIDTIELTDEKLKIISKDKYFKTSSDMAAFEFSSGEMTYLDRNYLEKVYSNLQEGYPNTNFIIDKQDNLWYPSHNGLYRRNPHIRYFSEKSIHLFNSLHTIAEDDAGRIWFGGYNQSGWSYWEGKNGLKRPKDQHLLSNNVLPGSLSYKGKIYFFDEHKDNKALNIIQNGSLTSVKFPVKVGLGYCFTLLKSGKIGAGLTEQGLLIFNPEKPSNYLIKNSRDGLLLKNVQTISEDKFNRIWMGRTSQGIACYDPGIDTIVTWLISPDDPESVGATSSKIDQNGDLWLGTPYGLKLLKNAHHFDIENQSVFCHLSKVTLPGNQMAKILSITENDNYLFVGTNKGIHLIDKTDKSRIEGNFKIFSLWYGEEIPGKGSEQNTMMIDSKGFLWVGTYEGVLRLDVNKLKFDTSKTKISLVSVKIGEMEMDVSKNIIVGPKGRRSLDIVWKAEGNLHLQNNLFASILILSPKNDTVFFQNQTRDKHFYIQHLPPNIYRVIIKAYKNNQLDMVYEKKIIIPMLISERILFWVFLTGLVTLIPLLILLNAAITKRKKTEYNLALEKVKRKQDSYRIKSLSNFFNPHFINNSLHWLQSRYRSDDQTITMIDSLAKNVELLYFNIQNGLAYHNLTKEIELVRNYLDIQQVRFKQTLKITLDYDIEAIQKSLIPSMLLQIHVENAVEKGIRNRAEANQLTIKLIDNPNDVTIIIDDDGNGRSNIESKNTNRKSSTEMMNDLLIILNSYNQEKISVSFHDKIIENKFGTKVIIVLPKNFNYEFEKI